MIEKILYRAPGNYDPDIASEDAGLKCLDESRAVQSDAHDADINTIVKRFGLTGELPLSRRVPLEIQDYDDVVDYRECLNRVMAARASFDSMPADVRSRFNNDPSKLVAFCEDPSNYDEGVKLGLLVPRPVVADAPAVEAPAPAVGTS